MRHSLFRTRETLPKFDSPYFGHSVSQRKFRSLKWWPFYDLFSLTKFINDFSIMGWKLAKSQRCITVCCGSKENYRALFNCKISKSHHSGATGTFKQSQRFAQWVNVLSGESIYSWLVLVYSDTVWPYTKIESLKTFQILAISQL